MSDLNLLGVTSSSKRPSRNTRSPERRCDVCNESIKDEDKTEFTIIDGIPGRRHTPCVEGK